MTQENIAIELKGVTKTFKGLVASNNVSLKIFRGEYVALLGPNGAGKTTLVEMIEGIQKPDSGSISLFGRSWQEAENELRKKIGFSLQQTHFIDKLTVLETLELFLSFYNLPPQRADELLQQTGLGEKKSTYTVNLSGGQRQKLALCIALAHAPEILILDEPTTGLDPAARRDIWEIVLKLKSQKTTLILTTHYLEEAEYLCDRILIMHKGSFLAQGTLEELLRENNMHEVIEFSANRQMPQEKLTSLPGVLQYKQNDSAAKEVLLVKDITLSLPKLLQLAKQSDVTLQSLECRKLNLDDLFLSMTGRTLDE
ncbi:MAG: ABC transporter ATP-binding protein [Spirochaetota bacterium]